MIDELDLAFEDDDRGRSRHRRGRGGRPARGGRRPKRRGRSLFALFLTLLLLAGLVGGGWYGVNKVRGYFAVKDYPGDGTGSVTIQIADGDQGTDIANKLYTADVVKSAKAFVAAFEANPASKGIEVGFYKLRHQMKASKALDMLLARNPDGSLANKAGSKVTITEGMISTDVFAALSKATNIPAADFANAAKNPAALGLADFWFKRDDNKQVAQSIEGFLYPATYDFDPGADATSIMKKIIANFNTEMTKLDFVNQVQSTLHISPYEGLVAASIAQVEGSFPEDMPGIARVLYNRAYSGKFPCDCLGLDSTVNYWLRITGKEAKASGALTTSQLHDPNNPYNTYDLKGLPIGPISNPGADALKGAMTAPKNEFYYFLAIDQAGHTAFASTYPDFCKKTKEAKANGVNIGVCNA
jgi:UPF0755 protein